LDPGSQLRTMRGSGRLYGTIVRSNELSPETVARYCSPEMNVIRG